MILNEQGCQYEFEGKTFVVGEKIYVTEACDYHGLFGVINEIRTGDDKETENTGPDLYCSIEPPVLPYEVEEVEVRFSHLYSCKKTIDDIVFDFVILSPEMAIPLKLPSEKTDKIDLYVVLEECCDDETNVYRYCFTDYVLAKQKLNEIVSEDFDNGYVHNWKSKNDFKEDIGEDYYEAWIDGFYCEQHYIAKIIHEPVILSKDVFKKIGEAYFNEYLRTCFKEQTAHGDGLSDLDDSGYENLLSSDELPLKIKEKLESDESLTEKFWEAVSSVCFDIIKERDKTNGKKANC